MSPLVKILLSIPVIAALGLTFNAVSASRAPASNGADSWWPTYGGSFANTRHVDLTDINSGNVGSLKLAWKFNTGVAGAFESTPIAVDGVVYFTTGANNSVFALNAATGRLKWRYVPDVAPAPYIFAVNRGVAVAGDRVFLTTLDARIIALDKQSGKRLWETHVGDPRQGLSETAAPLAWGGLVFVGSSGNEFGVRGSYSAYSQQNGKLVWRWWTVSPGWEGRYTPEARGFSLHRDVVAERASARRFRDSWKHGGGAIWMTPALSDQDRTIYLSTGNPAPAFRGERRPGDNLYTDSIVALDARSGKMKWYYQETPHDVWDFDASSPPILFDAQDASGRRIPAVGEASKTGLLYVLDRKTGHLLRVSDTFTSQPLNYRPPSSRGETLNFGGALGPIAYDRASGSAFVDATVQPQVLRTDPSPLRAWHSGSNEWTGGGSEDSGRGSDMLTAIDVNTGRKQWTTRVPSVNFSGLLSMPGLVFLGEQYNGIFRAYDASNGKVLWQVRPADAIGSLLDVREFTRQVSYSAAANVAHLWRRARHIEEVPFSDSASIASPPIAYRMEGREYVLIGSNVFAKYTHAGGDTLFAFTTP